MTISETIAYLQQFSKSGKPVKDLSRMQSLLEELGNPQEQLRFVHIAGTNGKGSVVAYGSAAAIAAGIQTGQFTSPFVRHYQDRIQVNGTDISDDRLCALCEQVTACHVSKACSQFEVTLAIALLYFVEQKCELVFLETGLGGLLDATNVYDFRDAGLYNFAAFPDRNKVFLSKSSLYAAYAGKASNCQRPHCH